MEVFKIDITSWTASFRYPNFMTSYHPTLDVPPISTILGLINAASGQYLMHNNLMIGYYFDYEIKADASQSDLETVYKIGSNSVGKIENKVTSDIIRREFLVNTFLRLYLTDAKLAEYFKQPYYPLLLGRMNDLATVINIEHSELKYVPKAEFVRGQIIPLKYFLPGQIQPLPKYFTNTFPRQNIGTEPYSVISAKNHPVVANFGALRDEVSPGKFVDIFFHRLNFQ